jgi:hypothetical protein
VYSSCCREQQPWLKQLQSSRGSKASYIKRVKVSVQTPVSLYQSSWLSFQSLDDEHERWLCNVSGRHNTLSGKKIGYSLSADQQLRDDVA